MTCRMEQRENHGIIKEFWFLSAACGTRWRRLCQQRRGPGQKRRQSKTQGFLQLCKFRKHLFLAVYASIYVLYIIKKKKILDREELLG